jgi:ABC-type multidrug transport system ATPase subunit
MGVLLELEHLSKCCGRGVDKRTVLRDVSLVIEPGELVAIRGPRRSGKSSLLRIAAGIEAPDSGVVRFAGHDLASLGDVLGGGIGYCQGSFLPAEGRLVFDQLVVSQVARGVSPPVAASRAESALARCGVEQCARLRPRELNGAEAVRVSIARALVLRPRLLVIDEPTLDVDVLARDEILLLLRSLADEGIAVLASTGTATGLAGSDRALSLSNGELHGHLAPRLAEVLPLRSPAARQARG